MAHDLVLSGTVARVYAALGALAMTAGLVATVALG
jgi:hypothetical protein